MAISIALLSDVSTWLFLLSDMSTWLFSVIFNLAIISSPTLSNSSLTRLMPSQCLWSVLDFIKWQQKWPKKLFLIIKIKNCYKSSGSEVCLKSWKAHVAWSDCIWRLSYYNNAAATVYWIDPNLQPAEQLLCSCFLEIAPSNPFLSKLPSSNPIKNQVLKLLLLLDIVSCMCLGF